MKITDEAKKIIIEALKNNNCDCLKVVSEKSCCGTSLSFGLTRLESTDKPVFMNGISVLIDEAAEARAEMITLAVEAGELVVQDDASCSSGCCDESCSC